MYYEVNAMKTKRYSVPYQSVQSYVHSRHAVDMIFAVKTSVGVISTRKNIHKQCKSPRPGIG